MRVVVTGASGHLARSVLPALCAHPAVAGVTGLDVLPAHFAHAKFQALRLPIGHRDIKWVLRGHQALVNLAFRVLRGKMALHQMEAINLHDQQHLFNTAVNLGVERLIHVSSAAVYGFGVGVCEDAPLQPLAGFAYAEQKARLENWLADTIPQCVRLRPHIILGPHSLPLLKQLLRAPLYVRLADPQPQLQCIHEDDVASAIAACLVRPVAGAFNLATADSYSLAEIAREAGRPVFAVPPRVARWLLRVLWRWRGWGGEPGWLGGIDRDLTLDCTHARQALQWQPQFSAREAIAAARD